MLKGMFAVLLAMGPPAVAAEELPSAYEKTKPSSEGYKMVQPFSQLNRTEASLTFKVVWYAPEPLRIILLKRFIFSMKLIQQMMLDAITREGQTREI
jgi:hypothetical protein